MNKHVIENLLYATDLSEDTFIYNLQKGKELVSHSALEQAEKEELLDFYTIAEDYSAAYFITNPIVEQLSEELGLVFSNSELEIAQKVIEHIDLFKYTTMEHILERATEILKSDGN